MADEAVCIGPANPSESYLNFDKIIEALNQHLQMRYIQDMVFYQKTGDFAHM